MALPATELPAANAPRARDGDGRVRQREQARDGAYNVIIAGFVKGTGSAKVNGETLSIQANVIDSNGVKGTLDLSAPVKGDHFSGSGTIMGATVTVRGRIDAPDFNQERALKVCRIVGTAGTTDGRYVKIVGELPGSGTPAAKPPTPPPSVKPPSSKPPTATKPNPPAKPPVVKPKPEEDRKPPRDRDDEDRDRKPRARPEAPRR